MGKFVQEQQEKQRAASPLLSAVIMQLSPLSHHQSLAVAFEERFLNGHTCLHEDTLSFFFLPQN